MMGSGGRRSTFGAGGAPEVLVCVNQRLGGAKASCGGRGSLAIADEIQTRLAQAGLKASVVRSPCQNNCEFGPSVRVLPNVEFFSGEAARDIDAIIAAVQRRADAAKA